MVLCWRTQEFKSHHSLPVTPLLPVISRVKSRFLTVAHRPSIGSAYLPLCFNLLHIPSSHSHPAMTTLLLSCGPTKLILFSGRVLFLVFGLHFLFFSSTGFDLGVPSSELLSPPVILHCNILLLPSDHLAIPILIQFINLSTSSPTPVHRRPGRSEVLLMSNAQLKGAQ